MMVGKDGGEISAKLMSSMVNECVECWLLVVSVVIRNDGQRWTRMVHDNGS